MSEFDSYLALLSTRKNDRIADRAQREYDRYCSIGEALKNHESVQRIVTRIRDDQACVSEGKCPPFYFIGGHSGVGKTQLPFAIRASGVDTSHIVMGISGEGAQPVYRNMNDIYLRFQYAFHRDARNFQDCGGDVTVAELSTTNKRLCTIAFICFELRNFGFNDVYDFVDYTPTSLRNYVISKQKAGVALPVFFLDEMSALYDQIGDCEYSRLKFRLARNIFSAAGLVVVLMGTGLRAASFTEPTNYVLSQSRSHPRDSSELWCRFISELPPVTPGSLKWLNVIPSLEAIPQNHGALVDFLKSQCLKCTPWFVELLGKALNEISSESMNSNHKDNDPFQLESRQVMDLIFYRMQSRLFCEKGAYLYGQVAMHLTWFKEQQRTTVKAKDLAVTEDRFVHHHFATPKGGDFDVFVSHEPIATLQTVDGNEYWPEAYYQGARNDSFMYLILGGGPAENQFRTPFRSWEDKWTSNLAFNRCTQKDSNGAKVLGFLNDEAATRDGGESETIAVLATEIASHVGGTGGIPVHQFLGSLAVELLSHYYSNWNWQRGASPSQLLPPALSNMTVPYLSSANDTWPAGIHDIPSCCFGNLLRTRNDDRVDFAVSVGVSESCELTGEAENHPNGLDLQSLKGIVSRIPSDSRLHLVFTSIADVKSFAKTGAAWSTYNESLLDIALLKVEVKRKGTDKLSLQLKPLFHGAYSPSSSYRCFLVVYPVDTLCEKEKEAREKEERKEERKRKRYCYYW